MTRHRLSNTFRSTLKNAHALDIYTHHYVEPVFRTIEHILPARLLSRREQQMDPTHLYMTCSALNRFRKDYCFCKRPEMSDMRGWEEYQGCFRNPRLRSFYPARGHRLIAHICWKMIRIHPDIIDTVGNRCFASWDVFHDWLELPWTPLESYMLDLQKHL